jgi:hypothetical protein
MLKLCAALLLASTCTALAQTTRNELKRADLTGTDMEVIMSTVELKPGDTLPPLSSR